MKYYTINICYILENQEYRLRFLSFQSAVRVTCSNPHQSPEDDIFRGPSAWSSARNNRREESISGVLNNSVFVPSLPEQRPQRPVWSWKTAVRRSSLWVLGQDNTNRSGSHTKMLFKWERRATQVNTDSCVLQEWHQIKDTESKNDFHFSATLMNSMHKLDRLD